VKLENIVFVTVEIAEQIHESILKHGGLAGTIDRSLLMSAIETPKTTFDAKPLYPSLAEIAATYAWGIVRNHPFVDGNKRTALLVATTFLRMNGHEIQVGMEWVDLMERVASDQDLQRSDLVTAFRGKMAHDEVVE